MAEGDTARLAIVTRNGPGRSVGLETLRLRSDSTLVGLAAETLGFPAAVALSGDTTWVAWASTWLPDEPDTARLLRLVVRTADASAVAEPLTVIGPEALRVDSLAWQSGEVAEGDTVRLAIVAANWRLRGVDLAVERLTSGGARVELAPDTLGLPSHVALSGDTTWVVWASRWLAEEPDTTRLLRLVVRTADSSAVAEPLAVVGPERPLYVLGLGWESGVVAEGDTARLAIVARNWAGRSVGLAAARLRSDSTLVALAAETLGFPATVALSGDTTRVAWASVWLPDEPDTARLLRLVVRTADSSAVAEPLTVIGPEALRIESLSWESGEVAEGDTARLAIVAANWRLRSAGLEAARLGSDGGTAPVSLGLPPSVALTADTTWVAWASVWLPDEPDTSRLMRLVVWTTDSSAVAEPLVVVGPEPVVVESVAWQSNPVAEGDTARLGIVARNWARRSVRLETLRLFSDGSQAPLSPDSLALPGTVALTADTTWVPWAAAWLPEEPDTARLMRVVVRTADSSAVSEPLVVVGPGPVAVTSLAWEGNPVAAGDTARLGIVAQNWARRSVRLETLRRFSDGSQAPIAPDSLALPGTVALTGRHDLGAVDGGVAAGGAGHGAADARGGAHRGLERGERAARRGGPRAAAVRAGAGVGERRGGGGGHGAAGDRGAERAGRSVGLETLRLRSDSTLVGLAAETLGFPARGGAERGHDAGGVGVDVAAGRAGHGAAAAAGGADGGRERGGGSRSP